MGLTKVLGASWICCELRTIEIPRFIAEEILEMDVALEPLQRDFELLGRHGLVRSHDEVVGEAKHCFRAWWHDLADGEVVEGAIAWSGEILLCWCVG